MRLLHTRWFPILVAGLVADANFWYFASTGENEADYVGLALFALFALYGIVALARGAPRRGVIAVIGSLAAALLMILRQTGAYRGGYIPPYAVFILAVAIGPL
jgi:hypothetical protein